MGNKAATLEVYRETVSRDKRLRTALTRDEAIEELAKIEAYLIAFFGEETYQTYYQGDNLQESETEDDADDGSSGELVASLEQTPSQESRKLMNDYNRDAARRIAALIRNYRRITGAQVEQPGAGQPATRPVDDPEGGNKPQPEAEGRRP